MGRIKKIKKSNLNSSKISISDIHKLPVYERVFLYENKLLELEKKIDDKTFTDDDLELYLLIFRAEESDPNKEYRFTGNKYTVSYK